MVLEVVWSVTPPSTLEGVAADPASGEIWATSCGRLFRFHRNGQLRSTTAYRPAPGNDPWRSYATLRLARFEANGAPAFLIPGLRRQEPEGMLFNSIAAFSPDGALLWEHERDPRALEKRGERATADSARDLCAVDLDGDGRDEVILSWTYAKKEGIQALNADGTVRWTHPGRSADTICAGPTGPDGEVEVIASSNPIRVLDRRGRLLREIRPGLVDPRWGRDLLFDHVRVVRFDPSSPPVILASDHQLTMVCFDTHGTILWSRRTDDGRWGHIMDLGVAADRPWIALETWRCRRLLVYDVRTGERLATTRTPGWDQVNWDPRLSWLPVQGDSPPLLIIGNTFNITAYALKPAPSSRDQEQAIPGLPPSAAP